MLLKSKEEASFNKTALGIGRSSRNKLDPSRLFLITLRLSFDSYVSLKKYYILLRLIITPNWFFLGGAGFSNFIL